MTEVARKCAKTTDYLFNGTPEFRAQKISCSATKNTDAIVDTPSNKSSSVYEIRL